MTACTESKETGKVVEKSFGERVAEAKAAVPAVSPQAARARQESDSRVLFIDPRSAADIAATTGLIPGALNVPLGTLNGNAELPEAMASRSQPIVTACQAGPMGALAAHALKQRGYTDVCYLDGGTQGWLNAGYATQR